MVENAQKKYCVYKHTAPNGKVYIGITCKNPMERWNNGNGYQSQKHFFNAIIKYGWDNFIHEILDCNLTKEEACKKEVELIKFYNSTNSQFGYNHSTGGECGAAGVCHTKETRKKMSEAHSGKNGVWYGKHFSEQHRKKLSEAHKGKNAGENSYLYGKTKSKEVKQKIGEALGKSVMCIETRKIYISTREAERQTKIANQNISSCCRGKYKTAGGFHWKYVEE